MTIRVRITFTDEREPKEFYATESYSSTAEGRVLYWTNKETNKTISYPVHVIAEIIESEVE